MYMYTYIWSLALLYIEIHELLEKMEIAQNKIYWEKKNPYIYLLCDDYVSDDTKVSTFLCTRKLGPEEVSVSLIAV